MILYELKCANDHVFEAWFRDSVSYGKQATTHKIGCPFCGSKKVSKAPMAPHVAKGTEGVASVPGSDKDENVEIARKARRILTELRDHVEKNCDYVGERFPEEARKIHYGETETRNIYGEASSEEADALDDEGVEVQRIPWLPRTDS